MGAIIDYLVERYGKGKLAPAAGTPERLRYSYWLHYLERIHARPAYRRALERGGGCALPS